MSTRWLQPNPSTDLHWGFLDKFGTNEYLPRAFLLATLATLAVAVTLHARRDFGTVPSPRPTFMDPIDIGPAPAIEARIAPLPRPVQKHVQSTLARLIPVPQPVDDAIDPDAATRGGPGSGAPTREATVAGDDPGLATGGAETSMPSPDDYVPVEHEPVLVAMQPPAYPELARDAGIDGTVLVRVLVGEDGFVHQALVLQSVRGLDEAALAAARTAVFRAALQQERPVAVWIVVPIEFQLH